MRSVHRAALVAVCLAAASSAGAASSQAVGSRAAQGIYGTVTLSSPRAVCAAEEPECARALVGARLVVSRDGDVVSTTRTGSEGGYRVPLAPGRYSVGLTRQRAVVRKRPHRSSRMPARPQTPPPASTPLGVLARRGVTVAEGEFRRVDFRLQIRGR